MGIFRTKKLLQHPVLNNVVHVTNQKKLLKYLATSFYAN